MKRKVVSLFIIIIGLGVFFGLGIYIYGVAGVKSIIAYAVVPNTDALLVFCAAWGLLLITSMLLFVGSITIWFGIECYKGKISIK